MDFVDDDGFEMIVNETLGLPENCTSWTRNMESRRLGMYLVDMHCVLLGTYVLIPFPMTAITQAKVLR